MPFELKELEDGYSFATAAGLYDGLDFSLEPTSIQPEATPNGFNIRLYRNTPISDNGYVLIGAVVSGTPRRVVKFTFKTGLVEFILFTNLAVYRWESTLSKWLILSSAIKTTATVGEAAGSTVIDVVSSAGFANPNPIGITLDNGDVFLTTVSSTGVGTITIPATGIPAGRTVPIGALVFRPILLTGQDGVPIDWAIHNAFDWLVWVNGIDVPYYYDGLAVQIVPGLPGGGNFIARTVSVFNNMLMFGNVTQSGTNMPQRITRSDTGDPTNWTTGTAGFNDLYDSSDFIRKLENLGPYQIVYRDKNITRGDWVGASDLLINYQTAVKKIGIPGPRAVAVVGDSHVLFSDHDIYEYRGGFDATPIGERIREVVYGSSSILNKSRPDLVHVEHIETTQEVWIGLPSGSSTYMDKLYRYSLINKSFFERTFPIQLVGFGDFESTAGGLSWLESAGVSWLGDSGPWLSSASSIGANKIVLCDKNLLQTLSYDFNAADDNAVPISWRVETKDLTARDKKIRVDKIDALIKGTGVSMEYSLDGGGSWNTYGTFADAAQLLLRRINKQVVGSTVRFAFLGTGPGARIGWWGFKYREESEW